MVAGKVKQAMGLQKSPANQQQPQPQQKYPQQRRQTPPAPNSDTGGKVPQKGAKFSRSFGAYFPRTSAQVQPRPPDAAELLHLVEELRERESRLRTELLEQKLLKESVAILPILENEISRKDSEINRSSKKIECLESENEQLRQDVEMLHIKLTEQKREFEQRMKELESSSATSSSSQRFQQLIEISGKSNMIKSLKRSVTLANFHVNQPHESDNKGDSDSKETVEVDNPRSSEMVVRSRVPRVPKPPPRPSTSTCSSSSSSNSSLTQQQTPAPGAMKAIAPPPPPPPPRVLKPVPAKVRRVPEVVEFYHSLMRRDSRRESGNGAPATDVPLTANARDMIGEIENRSTHLLAIKTDVETQGDFIGYLIKEVENAAFTDIEDVVPFVKWLDDELSYLVDERAVLKHFEWPEHKADALREAAFGYSDLKKLVSEAKLFRDDHRQNCASGLKKMQGLFEKLEHGVYNLSRMRESASTRYKIFRIPLDWMQETGLVSQMKVASVKLAMKYMKRVSAELETVGGGDTEEEELIVQGVKFAFRVHQFAGGFDVETMRAFQDLRDKSRLAGN